MATTSTIILKNGTSSVVPSSLIHGEPAINVTTGLLYYGSGSGNIVKPFSNFTHITASGTISSSAQVVAASLKVDDTTHFFGTKRFITSDGVYNFRDGNLIVNGNSSITGHITASGNISASATSLITAQDLTLDRQLTVPTIANVNTTHVTASGNVSASGIITTTIEGTGTTTGIETSGYLSSSALYVGDATNFVSASTGNLQGSGNITGFTSMSISYITASIIDVDGDTIRMGGESFTRSNIQALKLGRSLKPIRDGRNKPDVEGDQGIFESHVTASGDISSSGNIIGNIANFQNYNIKGESFAEYNATADALGIAQATNMKKIDIGKPDNNANILLDGSVTASGNISSSGNIIGTPQLQYNTSSITATGNAQGDIIKFGNTTTVAGAIYAHTGSGWVLAHSGSDGNASSSLALAVGTNSTNDGMLMRGMANIGYDPGGENGCALYLESPGSASHVSSGTSGHVVRVVGWNFGSDTIYFNPDNTWILRS